MPDSQEPSDNSNGLSNYMTDPAHNKTTSQPSQTASDFIDTQLQLEADAREALPYNFDHCTQPLGPLRQNLFSCLTCNPPPVSASDPYNPAAVCYSCSIACHGEHTLVELFNRRNFTCDCGTARLPVTSPCTLRIDPATGLKGPVHSQSPAEGNTYNQNCRNRFCACGEVYNAEEEKGTMFQCLGLADEKDGGCGEDWWHPECVVGLGREWSRSKVETKDGAKHEEGEDDTAESEHPLPPGFPDEDAFDTLICYKCVNATPWIKQYAGSEGFLPPVHKGEPFANGNSEAVNGHTTEVPIEPSSTEVKVSAPFGTDSNHTESSSAKDVSTHNTLSNPPGSPKKRSADDAELDSTSALTKKPKKDESQTYHASLGPPQEGTFSLFLREDFRDHFCRCKECYPVLKEYPQLLEEEESYEPPLSESGGNADGDGSVGTASLLDRGEAALSNVDRVRAIGEFSIHRFPFSCALDMRDSKATPTFRFHLCASTSPSRQILVFLPSI